MVIAILVSQKLGECILFVIHMASIMRTFDTSKYTNHTLCLQCN